MNAYQIAGYKNRREYLESLCEDYPREAVYGIASILGPDEDFDGLITSLEDDAELFFPSGTPDYLPDY